MKLEGKVALVTGGSQGIGQAIAIRLAQAGAAVVINYRSNPDGAKQTLSQVEAAGSRGLVVQADLASVEDIRRLVKESVAHFGTVDILVNNAGVEKNADFWTVSEEDYDTVLDTNLKGVFFATQTFVQHLIEAKRPGKIVNISSVHEELPFPHFTSYCASKGGLKMMTRNLAIELAPFNITINNVAPGAIETPINTKLLNDPEKLNALLANIPLKRLGQPRDVAGAVLFLASTDADYITGTTLFVDGGLLWNYQEQ
ncbi:glucose 1-dehydrogenase [Gloeobacter kilaueensis]|uniref:Glucose 1-dehydrogenase n=1 Tax=Gloeobacter kilaueensis (strain ATCC BAA-2537 / CCAP 1431/1 / ULC 316 / JS1) TaxID=1183438 RepID=U5QS78_GLOK1|nr:glucose 1-dehydrogenase [Gloeobacter kilaueensis]AGY60484.1 glucose 1-dehydrogenase [Gloeobacter kilaueensis JS1]